MKLEWLVTDVTAGGSSDRGGRAILGGVLAGRVFGQFRPHCGSGSHLGMEEPPLES